MIRKYFRSLGFVFLIGTLVGLMMSLIKFDQRLFILTVAGSFFLTLIIAIINLLYFLQPLGRGIQYLSPGLITLILFYYTSHNSGGDMILYMSIAMANLIIGINNYYKF